MTNAKPNAQPSVMSEILNSAAFSNRWQENFLNIVMRVAVVFGAVLFAYTLLHGDFRILTVYALILLLLAVATFAPVPYSVRADVFSGLIYLIGLTILLGYGISADASLFFLAFVAITALLFDYRAGAGALALSILTMIIVYSLVGGGLFKFLVVSGTTGAMADWITYGLDLSVPGAVIILAVYFLKREFNAVLRQVREIFGALQAQQAQLEERVAERTADLMRANQKTTEQALRLRTVAEVSRTAAAVVEPERLMTLLTKLISQQLGYYHIGIFLLDEGREYAILSAANSDGGTRMLARNHRLQVGRQGIVGYVTQSGKPRIALDVGADAVFFNNPDLPETHSEMCLPLKVKEAVIGALDIQSIEANAFSEEDYAILSILADQVAIAIQNARSAEETKRALHEAERASSQLAGRTWQDYSGGREVKGYQFRGIKAEPIENRSNPAGAHELVNVPIRLRGQVIGNLKLSRTDERRSWSDDELVMAQVTADRVAVALESARLLEDSLRKANKERVIGEISARIGSSASIDSIIRLATQELGKIMAGSEITIQLEPPKIAAER
ncbi:MAG TPA: GAF domain-containing protein [Anaerolineales bacterium]|nr:GAF domain-containing protein [Anaerolineales bacterium]